MDDQNKKQIVIIVVIIIILILILLGVLIVAVVTNKSTGGSLTNNTTMSVNTTTTTQNIQTTTVSTPSNSGNVDQNLLLQGIRNYLDNLKSQGQIGDYSIGEMMVVDTVDRASACPSLSFSPDKVYYDVILTYIKIPNTVPLTENEDVVDGRASVGISFALRFDGSAYIVEETFSC